LRHWQPICRLQVEDKHENMLPLAQQGSNNYSNNAREIREEFREYFVSPQGEVPWQ